MKSTSLVALAAAGALLVTAVFLLRGGEGEPRVSPAPSEAPETPEKPLEAPSTPDATARPPLAPNAPSARGSAHSPARFPDEAALMARLRELGQSDPALALEIAREGNERFSGSADAPERYHTLVKALENLGRFDEAREEARRMVDTYPGTPWTEDVERHVLRHPGKHPSQRGYHGE
jgi:hypothetical protein